MPEGTGFYDFTPQQGEGLGRIYRIECSGPYRAKGYLVRQDNLRWLPVHDAGLVYAHRLGRSHRHGLNCREHSHN
jgi:hypothetical protein